MRTRCGCRSLVAAVAGLRRGAAACGAAGRDLETLLDQATAYELRFISEFENVVAEEVYVQEMSSPRRKRHAQVGFPVRQVPGRRADRWCCATSFEVDGKPVRDAAQADRMMKLFTSPVRQRRRCGRARLAEEGARYNLLDIGTLEQSASWRWCSCRPTTGRASASTSPASKRVSARRSGPSGSRSSACRPSCERGANQDLPTRGLIWVDEQTGPRGEDAAAGRAAGGSRRRSSPRYRHDDRARASTCRPRCGTGIPTATAETSAASRPTAASGASRCSTEEDDSEVRAA